MKLTECKWSDLIGNNIIAAQLINSKLSQGCRTHAAEARAASATQPSGGGAHGTGGGPQSAVASRTGRGRDCPAGMRAQPVQQSAPSPWLLHTLAAG